MAFQLVIDCADPERMARFWAQALGYVPEPPPDGFETWDDYYRDLGLDESDLGIEVDSIVDPQGRGPRIWFQIVPEPKTVKNRLHIDVGASGGRGVSWEVRGERVRAEAARLVALGASRIAVLEDKATGQYGIAMRDPEGNEFDIH
jgi:catechol 2,3-dioxygenase-like lactoylglutathione lyase family enzyme